MGGLLRRSNLLCLALPPLTYTVETFAFAAAAAPAAAAAAAAATPAATMLRGVRPADGATTVDFSRKNKEMAAAAIGKNLIPKL